VVSGLIVAVVARLRPIRRGRNPGLIERYFGTEFGRNRLRHVLSMLAAAVIGTSVSGIGEVIASVLLQPPTVPILTSDRLL
jgi:hypothetical protein